MNGNLFGLKKGKQIPKNKFQIPKGKFQIFKFQIFKFQIPKMNDEFGMMNDGCASLTINHKQQT